MKALASLTASLLFAIGPGAQAEPDKEIGQKVVYHINYGDPKKQAGALSNIQNHIKAAGAENLDLRVVLHGNGLSMLLDPAALQRLPRFKHANVDFQTSAKIDALKLQGVNFHVCASTIRARGVDVERDLYDVAPADMVPSGIAELARLQGQGYVYIKP